MNNTDITFDCIVIGAGASGMTAAIMAARKGEKVCIIEHTGEPGKKILKTGNGKCNITNAALSVEAYPEPMRPFLKESFEIFGLEKTMEFFQTMDIYTRTRGEYVYPYSETALCVRNALWDEMKHLNVHIYTSAQIEKIINNRDVSFGKTGFYVTGVTKETADKKETITQFSFASKRMIIATGSYASPKTGSDGSGYRLLSDMGVNINKPYPALVKLLSEDGPNKFAKGVRHGAKATLYINGIECASDTGEVQFTDDGISGIPVFQISRACAPALEKKEKVKVVLDLLPEFNKGKLTSMVLNGLENKDYKTLTNFWGGLLPAKLVTAVANKVSVSAGRKLHEVPEKKLLELINVIKEYTLLISGTADFESAQVCSGGIDINDIDPRTMEIKTCPGLYVAGEIIDVDGPCGGYNLQWAWTSGAIAGMSGKTK